MKDPAQTAIEELGWTTQEAVETCADHLVWKHGRPHNVIALRTFQATQGHYRTPWLDSWAEVLRWIRGNKEKGTK